LLLRAVSGLTKFAVRIFSQYQYRLAT
jgi:hypothetical protein